MSKKRIRKIILALLTSALLVATGCSTSVQKNSDKNNSNNAIISPVNFQTEENKTIQEDKTTDEIPDDIFDDIKYVEITESSETVETTDNSKETSMSNSRVEISEPSEDNVTSNTDDKTENESTPETAQPENTVSNQNSTPEKAPQQPTLQQEPEQNSVTPQNNTPTTVKENSTTNTQNNNTNNTPTTTQNVTKSNINIPQKKEITSISLDKSNVTLDIGEKVKLNLTIYPSDATHKAYTFATSDNRVAEIDINGVITAKADGTSQITVTTDNGKTAQCNVTVRKPAPTTVSINPSNLKLSMNDVYTLSASNNVNSDSVTYDWSSSNTNCIKIISYKNNKIYVKAVGCGTSTVTVKTQNNVTASCQITVSKTDENVKEIVKLVNNQRSANGLKSLANRIDLNELADIRAKEIAEKFSHTRPDGSSCFTILSNTHYMSAGENIAYGQTTPSEVMNSWINSKGHRANILSSEFNCIGVGHYKANGIDYWVQIFIGD
ncbi:MAG: CAP domain-containing protein [Clostridia bacterium]|nr:CAP domain-containing protein [Clostridia bacterium]